MPNGMRRDILQGPPNQNAPDTSEDINLGSVPDRIDRLQSDNASGLTGRNTASFPGVWDQAFMPHTPTFRQQSNVFTAPRTIADDAVVPATYAGNPLP